MKTTLYIYDHPNKGACSLEGYFRKTIENYTQ